MYKLYKITSTATHKVYYGITRQSLIRRWNMHRHSSKNSTAALYNAIRKYGIETFTINLVWEFDSQADCGFAEQEMIRTSKGNNYNMHRGGSTGFSMRDKTKLEQLQWKEHLSKARQGRKPAQGMKHTEENKQLFGEFGKLRWDLYGRYPDEVLNYGFTEANKKFGISKTHYYRLRKQHNELL